MEALAPRPLRILRLSAVKAKTGQATSTIYAAMASGNFPRPVSLSERSVGWLESEVDDWVRSRIAARDAGDPWQSLGDAAARVVAKAKP
jgi:prophage regulatory protein